MVFLWCAVITTLSVRAQQPRALRPSLPRSDLAATVSGEEIYRAACATCHGPDGKGSPRSTVGFDTPLPDFTDCAFATAEADVDWMAVVHEGGRIRGLSRRMPAFGDALTDSADRRRRRLRPPLLSGSTRGRGAI